MIAEQFPGVMALPDSDKFRLIVELWDDVAGEAADMSDDPEMVALIEQRLEQYRAHPEAGSPWEAVRDRIRASRQP